MPDERLARTRRSLPPGYQFGDARATCPPHQWTSLGSTWVDVLGFTWDRCRCPCGREASRPLTLGPRLAPCPRHAWVFIPSLRGYTCTACGQHESLEARRARLGVWSVVEGTRAGWNVIEGDHE